MADPRIALVALDHPTLQDPRKKLDASTILSSLKKRGQAQVRSLHNFCTTCMLTTITVGSLSRYNGNQ
jgi:hypothetical protein